MLQDVWMKNGEGHLMAQFLEDGCQVLPRCRQRQL